MIGKLQALVFKFIPVLIILQYTYTARDKRMDPPERCLLPIWSMNIILQFTHDLD